MSILKKGHQPGVYVPLRALFLVLLAYPMIFPRVFIHFYCFHSIHEYSKYIFFITYHTVRVLCHKITLKFS